MSVYVWRRVWDLTLSPSEKLVLLNFANHANERGYAYPSINTVAKQTGLSERQTQRHVRSLENKGYLRPAPRSGRRTNCYTVLPSRATATPMIPQAISVDTNLAGLRAHGRVLDRNGARRTASARADWPPRRSPAAPPGTIAMRNAVDASGVTPTTPRDDVDDASGVTLATPKGDTDTPHG